VNWKGGVTRLLVVLWGLWGIAGLVFAASRTYEARRLAQDAQSLRLEAQRAAKEEGRPGTTTLGELGREVEADEKARVAYKAMRGIWGLWAALCVAFPALLLGAFRWIWSGFEEKRPSA